MRTGISITVTFDYHRRLERIVSDRNRAQKHIARAKVNMANVDGFGANEIVAVPGSPNPVSGPGRNASCTRAWMNFCATQDQAAGQSADVLGYRVAHAQNHCFGAAW